MLGKSLCLVAPTNFPSINYESEGASPEADLSFGVQFCVLFLISDGKKRGLKFRSSAIAAGGAGSGEWPVSRRLLTLRWYATLMAASLTGE